MHTNVNALWYNNAEMNNGKSNFKKLTMTEQEDVLIPLIIQKLQESGGSAMRGDVEKQIVEDNDEIAEYASEERIGKSGEKFHPFHFPYNFAIKNLAMADFLTYSRMQPLVLTEKGINTDPDTIDIENDVRSISKPKWDELSKKNKEKKASKTNEEKIEEIVEEETAYDDYKKELLNAVSKMEPRKFEVFSRALLKAMNVKMDDVKGIAVSNDGGIDGFGYHVANDFRTTRVAIQAKRWQGNVSSPEIDKFKGAMDKFQADYGVFITNSSFTSSAQEAARQGTRTITLIDGDKLAELVAKYEVYVKPVKTYELDSFYFPE